MAKYFDIINSNQEEIVSLIKQQRRLKEQEIKNLETERKDFEQQKSQEQHEMNMLLSKGSELTTKHEQKTIKLQH